MKIYVASSWRNLYQPAVVEVLRNMGHEVYDFRNPPHGRGGFSWSDIDPAWQSWSPQEYRAALEHPIAVDGFNTDMDGIQWAEVCVLVLPCGRSAHTEAGYMKGTGKPVVVYQPFASEPELMYRVFDAIITTRSELDIYFS